MAYQQRIARARQCPAAGVLSASISVDLKCLCPKTSDGCDVSSQWALRNVSWDMNVVDKFPTLRDVENGDWAGNDSPLLKEDSDDYLPVVAACFVHIMNEFTWLDNTGFKENLQVRALLCTPNPGRPPITVTVLSHRDPCPLSSAVEEFCWSICTLELRNAESNVLQGFSGIF